MVFEKRSSQMRFVLRRAWAGEPLPASDLGMDAHHQHFFVVGAVEDADPATLGSGVAAPQEVVVELSSPTAP